MNVRNLSDLEQSVDRVLSEVKALLLQKHHDYGALNIASSPGGPINGLRVRAHDKLARINNLVDNGKQANYESLQDSWIDLLGYALIATLVMRNEWPSQ